ncbi:hypothetical protein H7698_24490 [Pseudomonas sp. p50]|uniref:hypothetical protein n=1 Tax=Pseudomonas sp. p50(2008) TaxID=2816832 RepID=UPI00188CDF71|nr:hypothetical protein [Pseudomonas sp. p50(2008)]MBF4559241.1 hypothetical protein [Pseudomonas sp. p50(2008)]
MYKIVTFTPKELFDKVWETPVLKLAQEIGISDVALSKACRKAGLVLPPRGHWAKPVSKRPSKPKPPTDERPISFMVLDRSTPPARGAVPVQPKAVRSAIEVPPTLLAPHPLVSKWLKCINAAKPHEGYLVTTGKNVLDAKISAELIDRCALIFDTLIKESEVLGFKWKVTDEKTVVEVNDEHLGIKLVERLSKHVIPPPPPPAPKRNARWEPDFSMLRSPQFEWSSTGELSLQIDARAEYGKRKNWTDTKTGKIEEKLTSILDGFGSIAESVKALRLKNEEDSRERVAQEAVRLERVKREETHRRLRHRLVENTKRWEQSQRLRAFIQATCDSNADTSAHAQQQTALWAAWATSQANQLDPLHPNTSSVTSLTVEIEGWFNGYGMTRTEKDWWSE